MRHIGSRKDNDSIRSDEEPTLEMSAFVSLHGGQLTLSTQFRKPNFSLSVIIKDIFFIHAACAQKDKF